MSKNKLISVFLNAIGGAATINEYVSSIAEITVIKVVYHTGVNPLNRFLFSLFINHQVYLIFFILFIPMKAASGQNTELLVR